MREFTLDDLIIIGGVLIGFLFVAVVCGLVWLRRERVTAALRWLAYGATYVAFGSDDDSEPQPGTPDRNARNPPAEPTMRNPVPVDRSALLARILSSLPEDELIDVLAQMTAPDGAWRYAESRIGKFAPGRLEDRIEQVRAIRGTPPTPKAPGRELTVRDKAGERRIPFDEVTV